MIGEEAQNYMRCRRIQEKCRKELGYALLYVHYFYPDIFDQDPQTLRIHDLCTELATMERVQVDCDSYTSTNSVLRYIKTRMQKGSIIVFDDYYLKDACQKRSVEEFIASGQGLQHVSLVKTAEWRVPIYV